MIPDSKIAEVRERSDIAEVIRDYVTLKSAGANLKGVCPFHGDSDPSFNVNPARQFFHCFGCQVSGDAIGFLRRIEGIEFMDAVKRLAARFGVELPEERPLNSSQMAARDRKKEESNRRYYVLESATAFFEHQLTTADAKDAIDELARRGVDLETAKNYRLGYSPDAWTSLIDNMQKLRITANELESVGLARPRQSGGHYDAFRHRLMFTITDASGRPIAFSARILREDPENPGGKYINSPETLEYKKGDVLFGLHQARVAMSKASEAILVEGNFDVVALAMAGMQNVVAPLGTALTEKQALLLRRRVESVSVMFDGDRAGRTAAARAFPILAKAGLVNYTIPLTDGEDPDSLLRRIGSQGMKELHEKKRGLLEQIIEDAASAGDGSVQDSAKRIDKMRPFLEALRSPTERDLYSQKIAEAFRVDSRVVFRALRGGAAQVANKERAQENEVSPLSPRESAERELIGVLLDQPELCGSAEKENVIELIRNPAIRVVFEEFLRRNRDKESFMADLLSTGAIGDVGPWLAQRAMACLYKDAEIAQRALTEIRAKLFHHAIQEQVDELESEIHSARTSGDDDRLLDLMRQKTDLQKSEHRENFQIVDGERARA